jgi:translation initiation factor 5A
MVLKIVDAYELKPGSFAILDGEAYCIKSVDVSKTGKHGASKCRFEAIAVIGDKKKIAVFPGGDRIEVPMIDKRKAQVLALVGDNVSVMDSESFENFELSIPEEFKGQITDGSTIEYWDVEGKKIIKRIGLTN